MCNTPNTRPYHLDTLETSGHSHLPKHRETLVKRTLQKATTLENSFKLIDQAKKNGSPLLKAYWSTYHCGGAILQEGEKFSFKRCKKKWCRTCANIRTAEMINGYKHLFKEFKEPQMLVLTMKNCKSRQLRSHYQKMVDSFKLATRNIKKTHGIRLHGIRTWECTYNLKTDEYHPHFNVVVDTREGAELLRSYWLSHWKSRQGVNSVNIKAQFITDISTSQDLLEVFKYTTKLAVSHEEESKAQDWIYQCTHKKKMAQPFGALRRVKIEDKEIQEDQVKGEEGVDIWLYEKDVVHYVNAQGETLVSDNEKHLYLEKVRNKKKLKKLDKKHKHKPKKTKRQWKAYLQKKTN